MNGLFDNNVFINNSGLFDGTLNGVKDNLISITRGIIIENLIVHLDPSNRTSYSGSGTTFYDLSSSKNNFSLTSGPIFVASFKGNIEFDGVNDRLDPASDFGATTGPITICTWVKIYKTTGVYVIASRVSEKSPYPQNWDLYVSDGVVKFQSGVFSPTNTQVFAAAKSSFALNKWYFVCAVYSGSSSKELSIYLNGLFQDKVTRSTDPPTSIGTSKAQIAVSSTDAANYYFNGAIGLFSFYNKALSASEILYNYNATKSRFGL